MDYILNREDCQWLVKEDLYRVAGISKQGYMKYIKHKEPRAIEDKKLQKAVERLRKNHKKMGSRSLYHRAKKEGLELDMGINKFEKTLSRLGLTIQVKKKRIITTIAVKHQYPNLTNALEITGINQLIVGDITYYKSKGKLYYIFTLKDYYSKRIVGLFGAERMYTGMAIKALRQMLYLRRGENLEDMIHHSDAGGQYLSVAYKKILNKYKILISVAKNCLENGSAEQLNGVIKNDYLDDYEIGNVVQLNRALKKIKKLINGEKPIEVLDYKTPVEFEEYIKNMTEEERPKVVLYDFNKTDDKEEGGFEEA